MPLILRIVKAALFAGVAALAVVLGLIFSERPAQMSGADALGFAAALASPPGDPAPLQPLRMADGYDMQIRTYGGADRVPLVVLLHGAGWHGLQFDSLAKALAGKADVIVPDLRGHGTTPGERGDITYIGEIEEDLARMILMLKKPDQKVIMGGIGMGGGLVVRFAGGPYGGMLDGAILLAPHLGHAAPPTRESSGGWAQLLRRRMLGLDILNAAGITALNHLPVIAFDVPQAVLEGPLGDTVTPTYSYRLHAALSPRGDSLADVAALPPFVLLAGSADALYINARYAPTMGAVTDKGRFDMLLGGTHFGIVDDPRTQGIIEGFLDGY